VFPEFPATALPLWASANLSGAMGRGNMRLEIVDLEDFDEPLFVAERRLTFGDRLAAYHLLVRIDDCTFPAAGWYNCQLLIDDLLVAQQRIRVESAL
jgi:hypothetical protein